MKLEIPDMSCGGCAQAVTRAVNALDPNATLVVDVPVRIVRIDSALPPDQLMKAIKTAGFHPASVS